MKKRLLAIVLAICALFACAFGLASCGETATKGLAYYLRDDGNSYGVKVGEAKGNSSIVVPAAYEGKPIVEILEGAFADCEGLKSVKIPSSVEKIGVNAFKNCSSLQEMTIPFVGASKEGEGSRLFGYLFGANSLYESIDSVPSSLKKVTVTSATSIGDYAFTECRSLAEIVLPEGVESIGDYAFSHCSSLTKVVLPFGVKRIGDSAFSGCSSLTEIVLPDSVESIGSNAFCGYGSLLYTVEGDCRYLGNSSNPYLYLAGVTSTTISSVTIKDTCKFIGFMAFENCSNLTEVVLPFGVKSIGDYAFENCSGLRKINLPDSVTDIRSSAFANCGRLTEIVIPDTVASIGAQAFYLCGILRIYCEAPTLPSGWDSDWNPSNRSVVWGYTGN